MAALVPLKEGQISHYYGHSHVSNTHGIPTIPPEGHFYILINSSSGENTEDELTRLKGAARGNEWDFDCNTGSEFLRLYITMGGELFKELDISEAAKLQYVANGGEIDPDELSGLHLKTDVVLQGVLSQLGSTKFYEKESGWFAGVGELHMYPNKYKKYYQINEYDGIESIEINYDLQQSDEKYAAIESILYSMGLTPEEQIAQLKELIPRP